MATRPVFDKSVAPLPVADRLLLAEELLDLAERALSHTHAAGSAIALQRGNQLFIRTSSGMAPEVGACLPVSEGTMGQCARTVKPFNVSEEDKLDTPLRMLGVRSLIAVPIHHAGIFYGVLVVTSQSPDAFTRMHVAIMMTMGNEVARVLKRLDAMEVEVVPGTPLRTAPPANVPDDNVVTISLTPTARQDIGETLKTIEQKPATPPPMKLMIDQPISPKTAPAAEKKAPATTPPTTLPASFIELNVSQPAPKPLADLLPPGEDPRHYGTLKTAKSLEPKPTFVAASAYRPTSSSHRRIPFIAAAVLVLAVAGVGVWRHEKTKSAHETAAAAAEPSIVPAAAASAEAVKPVAPAPAPVAATPLPEPPKKAAEVKPVEAKTVEAKTVEAKTEEVKAKPASEPALHLAATSKNETPVVEAPALTLASTSGMPDLLAPKAPAASLAVRKSTAVPPTLVRSVAPSYPELARRSGTYGEIKLQLKVSTTGKITDVHVVSGPMILRQAAAYAASQWQYRPAMLDGRPVESSVDATVKFGPQR